MAMTHDRDLARLLEWDLDAFGDLYETYAQKIYSFLFYKTFDKEVAEDLTQETFLKALKNRKSFHGTTAGEFSSWIHTIAYNSYVDHFRVHKPSDELDESSDVASYYENLGNKIDTNDKIVEILSFLDTLPKEQKDIVVMRLWDELSYKEISEITGKSVDGCKKTVSRVLAQIQSNVAYVFAICFIHYYFHN